MFVWLPESWCVCEERMWGGSLWRRITFSSDWAHRGPPSAVCAYVCASARNSIPPLLLLKSSERLTCSVNHLDDVTGSKYNYTCMTCFGFSRQRAWEVGGSCKTKREQPTQNKWHPEKFNIRNRFCLWMQELVANRRVANLHLAYTCRSFLCNTPPVLKGAIVAFKCLCH